jgi:hypothetical protein
MELVAGHVEAFHCGFADLDAFLVAARVERAFDRQTGLGGRRADQFDHGKTIRKRPAAPVLRDVAEQSVDDDDETDMGRRWCWCRADNCKENHSSNEPERIDRLAKG